MSSSRQHESHSRNLLSRNNELGFEVEISPTTGYYELGITRLFGERDLSVDGLTSGWSFPEEGHVWNDGFDAVFEVLIDERPVDRCTLTFEGEPFLSGGHAKQDMVLFLNGFRLGFWRLTEARTYSLSVTVEPEQVFKRGDKAYACFVWHLPDSVRPQDAGLGPDGRILGFCFRSFTLVMNNRMR